MDKQLLPCPFCGSKANLVHGYHWVVLCSNPDCRCTLENGPMDEKGIIKAWNTRPLKESGWQGMEMSINQMVDIIGEHLRIGKRGDDWSIVGIREAARAIHAKLSAQPGRGNNG